MGESGVKNKFISCGFTQHRDRIALSPILSLRAPPLGKKKLSPSSSPSRAPSFHPHFSRSRATSPLRSHLVLLLLSLCRSTPRIRPSSRSPFSFAFTPAFRCTVQRSPFSIASTPAFLCVIHSVVYPPSLSKLVQRSKASLYSSSAEEKILFPIGSRIMEKHYLHQRTKRLKWNMFISVRDWHMNGKHSYLTLVI